MFHFIIIPLRHSSILRITHTLSSCVPFYRHSPPSALSPSLCNPTSTIRHVSPSAQFHGVEVTSWAYFLSIAIPSVHFLIAIYFAQNYYWNMTFRWHFRDILVNSIAEASRFVSLESTIEMWLLFCDLWAPESCPISASRGVFKLCKLAYLYRESIPQGRNIISGQGVPHVIIPDHITIPGHGPRNTPHPCSKD